MKNEFSFDDFLKEVSLFSNAYSRMEKIQKNEEITFVPKHGDQKTGLIGEVYIYKYLEILGYTNLQYGGSSEKGWDIKGFYQGKKLLVQVKTVSAHSKTRTISPIHDGWDHLYLLSLDENFWPNGLWVITDSNLLWKDKRIENVEREKLSARKMKHPEMPKRTGSLSIFNHAENKYAEFTEVMGAYSISEKDSHILSK